MANSYDIVRYPSWPISNTHPVNIGAYAALLGRPFTSFGHCRVLEIGCGEGINLMSMALGAPGSEFVGIDLAEAPITHGRALAQAAGIANVRLEAQDVTRMSADIGSFDYIIAHGVYAWVPEPVRHAIMTLIGARLSPQGLAFISYNTDPGCSIRKVLREIMLDALHGIEAPDERLAAAHETLSSYIELWSDTDPLQSALKTEARDMLKRPPALIFHDELGSIYAPQRLSHVTDAASAAGLSYLCDTRSRDIAEMFSNPEPLSTNAWIKIEQARDFAEMRLFRQSLFCCADEAGTDRRFAPKRLRNLWVTGKLTALSSDQAEPGCYTFRTSSEAEFDTHDTELADFLTRLGQGYPASLPLDTITEDTARAEAIFALSSANYIDLSAVPFSFATTPGDYPLASPLARVQAANGEQVLASLRHKPVRLADEDSRYLLALLDGTRTYADLTRAMSERSDLALDQTAARVMKILNEFLNLGLLSNTLG